MIKLFAILLSLTIMPILAQQGPCDEPVDEGGIEEPIDPDLGEPGPIGEEEIGCYDEYQQWVPGGFIVYFFHEGTYLGSECVAPASETKRAGGNGTSIDGYLFMDISAHGVDRSAGAPAHKRLIAVEHAWALGVDFDRNGRLDSRYELLGGHRRARNAVISLSEFDMPRLGGNDDGMIDRQDAVWPQLLFRNISGEETLSPSHLGISRFQTIPRADTWPRYERMTIDALGPDGALAFTLTTFPWRHLDFGQSGKTRAPSVSPERQRQGAFTFPKADALAERRNAARLLELAPKGIGLWDDTDLIAKFDALTPPGIDPWDPDWLMSRERFNAFQRARLAFSRARDTLRLPMEEMARFGLEEFEEVPHHYRVDASERVVWFGLDDFLDDFFRMAWNGRWEWLDELEKRGFDRLSSNRLRSMLTTLDPKEEERETYQALVAKAGRTFEQYRNKSVRSEAFFADYMRLIIEKRLVRERVWHRWATTVFSALDRRHRRILVAFNREVGMGELVFTPEKHAVILEETLDVLINGPQPDSDRD